jgi:hypothetical protein
LPTRPNEDIPEPWLSFLRELDSSVHEDIRLDCMGGFIVSIVYGFSRPTGDLDVLEIPPKDAGRPMLELGMQGGPLHKKYKIYLDHVSVAHVPENYEDRVTEIYPNVSAQWERDFLKRQFSRVWRKTFVAGSACTPSLVQKVSTSTSAA